MRYTGEINDDGVLKGNVYVIGAGDPYINGEVLWKMVRDMKIAGVTAIHGGIYFDDTLFAGTSYIPGWGKEVDIANGPSYFPMRSSLSFNPWVEPQLYRINGYIEEDITTCNEKNSALNKDDVAG